MIVFDTTMLLLLKYPHTKAPLDPKTGKPLEYPQERIAGLVEDLEKFREKIIIPTPVLSEFLINAGKEREKLFETIQKNSVFRIVAFDAIAAIEVAEMASSALAKGGKRGDSTGIWAKIKYDRQILAIAKVHRANAIYTDDNELIKCAESNAIKAVRLADIAVPDSLKQGSLFSLEEMQSGKEVYEEPADAALKLVVGARLQDANG